MSASLFFYDLETSGLYPDSARIMQFAGQRTDTKLNPIGEPCNVLIAMSEDQLPDPAAVLVHGISPQQTKLEGLTEAQFLKYFYRDIVLPETTFVGFNNIRFDDEFIRFLNYRNLRDAYAWGYEDGRSRWDVLDVVRMTRALRPEGINWPVDADGKNTNRLELLAKANALEHGNAHDALSDTQATIDLARLIQAKQPKLFSYMFALRLKAVASRLVNSNQPFVYTSSHYPADQYHTTVVVKLTDHPSPNCVLVYDLRYDPTPWLKLSPDKLLDAWRFDRHRSSDNPPLPVKTMRLNRCPAIAPIGVLGDRETNRRLSLNMDLISEHLAKLRVGLETFAPALRQAVALMNAEQEARQEQRQASVDGRLYEGFYSDNDRKLLSELHLDETPAKLREIRRQFADKRLKQLGGFYLARNYKDDLTEGERKAWDAYVKKRLMGGGENSRLALYFKRIEQLVSERSDPRSQSLLEDLKLYGEAMIPSDIWD